MSIEYRDSVAGLSPQALTGFFVGWPHPPSADTHLAVLQAASHVEVAVADGARAVGFVYAISDGLLSAYVPLLEVLPAYQGQGIGTELVRLLLRRLDELYMVDLTCDAKLLPFYERFGFKPYSAAIRRNMVAQSGARRFSGA